MWSKKDLQWLKKNHPGLLQKNKIALEGRISFQMLYANGRNYINPTSEDVAKFGNPTNYICDTYEIRIEWDDKLPFPNVKELGVKITSTAERYGLHLGDIHLYPDKSFCLASWQDLFQSFGKEFDLASFINEYLIPYLFAQSYYAMTKEWPWGQLSHGCWGLLEWLGRKSKVDKKDAQLTAYLITKFIGVEKAHEIFSTRCRSHKQCLCGSGKKNRDCHPDIKDGIAIIRGELSRNAFSLEI